MNCSDVQLKIAADADGPAIAEHVTGCPHCAAFARELADNQAAVKSVAIDPAAYAAVRARVLSNLRHQRRFAWVGRVCSAAAAIAIVAALLWPRFASVGAPRAVTFAVRAPEMPVPVARSVRSRAPLRTRPVKRLAARVRQPLRIEIATDDPNVRIIWLMDEKGGGL